MERTYSTIMQLIGLGSAGTNIVDTFLADNKTLELLKNENIRLAFLAIDIADPEIKSLQNTYERITKAMKAKGIPKERARLIAESIKFPTAEAMFDFINQKYKEQLIEEGVKLKAYIPWLPSTMAIPPLAGGAGRRRALAKAIYALNYYQLGIIRSFQNSFKEQALSSIITPTVVVIFGLGGGTGSGIVFDFVRHLRKILGSGVPVIGLAILPCVGDDPPAKGCSAFASLKELSLLLNKNYNEQVCKSFGNLYQNPFNALICLPLMPAYSKVGNIVVARKEMDEMLMEMIYVLMDFDLADLFGGIGTEVGLTENFVHTMSMVKVTYPVDEYILAFKSYLERLQLLYELRKEKLAILKGIYEIIQVKNDFARDIYKKYLIKTGTYTEEQFEEKIKAVVYSSPRFEEDYALHLKALEEQIRNWINELMKFLSSIRLVSKTGTIEEAIVSLTLHKDGAATDNLEGLLTHITKTHSELPEKKAAIFERLKQLIPSSQNLTVRQKKILEDFMNLAELVERSLNILRFYNETRHLTEALITYYSALPEQEFQFVLKNLKDMRSELTSIYHILQLMLKTPFDEAKIIDEHLTYIHGIIAKLRDEKSVIDNEFVRIQEMKKRKEFDKSKIERELTKIFQSKKYLKEQRTQIERDLKKLGEEEAYSVEELKKLDYITRLYQQLTKKIEVTSDYRKRLNKILDLYREYQDRLSNIIKPKKYFERTTELTEGEQTKIIFKILAEQEETLSREGILKEILDMEHFKEYMKSVIRVFRTPSIMGYKPTYKSDHIWVTVQTPQGLWSEDLTQEIYTALAGYVTGEVSRTVTVRVIDSRDPWIIRVLLVGGRGKPEDLEAYDEMRLLFSKATDFERHLSHSFLIEHGITAEEVVEEINTAKQKTKEILKKIDS